MSAEILTSKERVSMQISPYESTITSSVRGVTEKGHFTLTILRRSWQVIWAFLVLTEMPLVFEVTDRQTTEEGIKDIHNTHFLSYTNNFYLNCIFFWSSSDSSDSEQTDLAHKFCMALVSIWHLPIQAVKKML